MPKTKHAKPEVNKTLAAATATYRDEYRARYEKFYMARLNQIRAELAANGMDAKIVAGYPKSGCSRATYAAAVEKHSYVNKHFAHVASSWGMRDPEIVVERPKAEAMVKAEAKQDADMAFDGYLLKLAGKIGKEIETATYTGHLWAGSVLAVECKDGEKQEWETKCILNRSVLGTIFTQWPTRRTDGVSK